MVWHRAVGLLAALSLLSVGNELQAAPGSLPQALIQLSIGDPKLQVEALHFLGTSRDPRVVPVLSSWASSGTGEVHVAAVRSLGAVGSVQAWGVIRDMARGLHTPGQVASPENLALLEVLASFSNAGAATELLGLVLEKGPFASRCEQLLQERFPQFWQEANRVLNGPPTVPNAAVTSDAAVTAETEITPDAAVTAETDAASHSNADVATLLQWLYAGPSPQLRAAAALALAAMRDARALPVLEAALRESNLPVQEAALKSLREWDTPESSAALAGCVVAGVSRARAGCLEALFGHQNGDATLFLEELEWSASHLFGLEQRQRLKERLFLTATQRAQARYLPEGGDDVARQVEVLALLAMVDSPQRQLVGVNRSNEIGVVALPVLANMLEKGPAALRSPLLTALSSQHEALAWDALAAAALSPALSQQEQVRVVEILGSQPQTEPAQRLIPVAARTTDPTLRKAVRATLAQHHPELLPSRNQKVEGELAALLLDNEEDRSGYVWLAMASAAHGAGAMAFIGADGATVLPALGGAVLGATLPLWLTANDPRVTGEHAFWTFSTGNWVLAETALLASSLGDGEAPSRLALVGLGLAEAGGTVFGALTRKSLGESAASTGFMNLSWAAGMLGGVGAYGMLWPNEFDDSTFLGLVGAGGLAGLLGSGLLGSQVEYTALDGLLFAESVSLGAFAGGWFGYGWRGEGSGTWGTALLGASTGYLVASILGAYEDQRVEDSTFQLLSAGAGTLLAHGATSLASENEDTRAFSLGGGAVAGALLARLSQEHIQLHTGDVLGVSALTAAGAWNSAWLQWMAQADEASGPIELGIGAGYLAGMILGAVSDPAPETVGVGTVANLWGNLWGGGLGLALTPHMDERWIPAVMLPASWGATLLATAGAGDLPEPKGDVAALVGLGGAWGALQGFGLAQGLGAESDSVRVGATMLGVSTGLLAGGLTGLYFPVDALAAGRMATGGALGSIIGTGAALLVPEFHDEGVYLAALSLGWTGLIIKGLWVPPAEFTQGDYLAVAAGGGWGLFQGAMIANAAGLEGSKAAGAQVLGMGIGLLGGELFARARDFNVGEVLFTEFGSYTGSGLLSGAYLLSDNDDSAWVGGLSAAGGLLGKLIMGPSADQVQFRADDTIEYLYMQGWGLWQGLGMAAWADASDNQTGGAALLGMSLGFLLPMLTNQVVDYSPMDDLLIVGGSIWGTWIGGWMSYALGNSGSDLIPAAAIAGDVGLVLAAVASVPAMGVRRSTLGWMHVGGAAGMGLGTVVTAIITASGESIALGMSIGSVAGLLGGAALASGLSSPSTAADDPRPLPSSLEEPRSERHAHWTLAGIELPYVLPTTFLVPGPPGHQDDMVSMYGVEGVF